MKDERLHFSSGKVLMSGSSIRRVSEWKYQSDILSENLTLNADTARMSRALLKQFHLFRSKFYYLIVVMLKNFFRTYTSSFHGAESWYNFINASVNNDVVVVYHKCVRNVVDLNVFGK